jgi:hypothetical protein
MIERKVDDSAALEPVHAGDDDHNDSRWTERLVLLLRVMAGLSLFKGLYHWAVVCGIVEGAPGGFEVQPLPWQTATVFFAVIDLVAAIGLWLAAAWGAVVWLTAVVSMAAVELLFPQIYGGGWPTIVIQLGLLAAYLALALQAARERPP